MIEHSDGSVTLSAQEFRVCHAFCELSAAEFKKLLESKDDGTLTVKDMVSHVMQCVILQEFKTDGAAPQ